MTLSTANSIYWKKNTQWLPGLVRSGTIHIFQMDWKRYVIALAKYLQSALRPEVHWIHYADSASMAPCGRLLQNPPV